MKTKLTTLAIIAITIISCNNSKKSNSENTDNNTEMSSEKEITTNDVSIENTKWIINKLEGGDITDNGQEIFFILDSKTNRVSGNSGCNTFMGTYKLEEGKRISFSQMASTRMACPDSKINESEILNIFNTVDNFTLTNGQLALNIAKRAPLATFKKAKIDNDPIVEKHWKLKTLEGKDMAMAENQEREIYFTLKSDDNRVVGFAGCNTLGGEYKLEAGNRIRFSGMLTTLKACPDVDVNEAEFLKVFELADNYTIKDDVLSLNVGRRAPLAVFEAVHMQ